MVATKRYRMSLWFKKVHLFMKMMKNTTKEVASTEMALEVREMAGAGPETEV